MDINESLLYNLPGLVFWKDINSVFIGANKNFLNLVNPAKNLIGSTDYDIHCDQYASLYQQGDKLTIEHGKTELVVPLFVHDEIHICKTEKTLVLNSEGTPEAIIGQFRIIATPNSDQTSFKAILNQPHSLIGTDKLSVSMFHGLTQREMQVLYFYVRGKEIKSIATFMNLSPKSIESHIARIKLKWRVEKKSQLISKAICNGFFNCKPALLVNKHMA